MFGTRTESLTARKISLVRETTNPLEITPFKKPTEFEIIDSQATRDIQSVKCTIDVVMA